MPSPVEIHIKNRSELSDKYKDFDPFDLVMVDSFISEYNIKIDCVKEKNRTMKTWGYEWEGGGVDLRIPEGRLTEQEVRQVVALGCYLYMCGVNCALDDRLALAYITQARLRDA